MGQEPGAERAPVTQKNDPEEIREDIEATREELGETVSALSEKTDVKAQAKQKLDQTKGSVADKKDQLLGKATETSPDAAVSAATQASQKARENPLPLAVGGAFAAGFLIGRISRR